MRREAFEVADIVMSSRGSDLVPICQRKALEVNGLRNKQKRKAQKTDIKAGFL